MDKENIEPKVTQANIKSVRFFQAKESKSAVKEVLKKKGSSATTEFETLSTLYRDELLPKIDPLFIGHLSVVQSLDRLITTESSQVALLQLMQEQFTKQRVKEQLEHEMKKSALMCELKQERAKRGNKEEYIRELREKRDKLQSEVQEVSKKHQELASQVMINEREKEEQVVRLRKEKELNKVLTEKREVVEQLQVATEARLSAIDLRVNHLYKDYEKHLHNKKLELKGNIRVFCRVRPVLEEDIINLAKASALAAQNLMRGSIRPVMPSGVQLKTSSKRMNDLIGPGALQPKLAPPPLSQQTIVNDLSPGGRNRRQKIEVEETIQVKGEHSLELKLHPKYYSNQGQFLTQTYLSQPAGAGAANLINIINFWIALPDLLYDDDLRRF